MNNIEETAEIKNLLARARAIKENLSFAEQDRSELDQILIELNVALRQSAGVDSILE